MRPLTLLLLSLFAASNCAISQEGNDWIQLMPGSDFTVGLADDESHFDRVNQRIYFRDTDSQTLGYVDLSNSAIVTLPATGWFGTMTEMVVDPDGGMIYGWRAGRETVYGIPTTGGAWSVVSSNGGDAAYYGASSFWNPLTNGIGIYAGYGGFSMKNAIHEIPGMSGGWVETRPNTNTGNPPRAWSWVSINEAGDELYIYGRHGNINGSQYQYPLSIVDGANYNWARGLWKVDLSDHSTETLISLDDPAVLQYTDIAFDHNDNRIYVSGGSLLASNASNTNQGTTTNITQFHDLNSPNGFELLEVGNTYPAEGGPLWYDGVNDRLLHYGASGLWSLSLAPPGPVEGCTDPTACNYDPQATIDDGTCSGTCIDGCTDPTACNFNPDATEDDGSCIDLALSLDDVTICPGASVTLDSEAPTANTGTVCGSRNENGDPLILTAPAGEVFTSVEFASYGTPNGSCGSHSTGSCHASNSIQVVSNLCLGQNSCTVYPNNSTFGDPCGGTYKRLFIELGYGSDSGLDVSWSNGSSESSITVQPAETTTYTVTVTSAQGACSESATITVGTPGCMEPTACNYDPNATCDDASCIPSGCMDSEACNYNPAAQCDGEPCDYCECIGEFHMGVSFNDPIVAHGNGEFYTTWGGVDLSPIEGTNVRKFVGGEGYFLALREDSTVATLCSSCLYGNAPPSSIKAIDVAAGRHEGCMVRDDGSLLSFGANYLGLHNEPTVNDAIACAASWNFHMALREDGSLIGWGDGWHAYPGTLTGITAIDAGITHAIVLLDNGQVREWGYNDQTGVVMTSGESITSLTGVVDIAAGSNYSMAIFQDGSAKAWTWPDGNLVHDIPASEGVVDGAINWSVFSYITYDGRSVTSSNLGQTETLLNIQPQIECGVCIHDFDGNGTCNEGAVLGCIEPTACNYDAAHTVDDGSCIPSGCMDQIACNYNAAAQCAGEACDYSCCPGPGCCDDPSQWDAALQQCNTAAPDTIVVTDTLLVPTPFCGAGTHWDPVTEMCIADAPGTVDENCTVMNLQELAEGYQVLLDHTADQDSIILAQQATIDALDALCGCSDPVEYQGYSYDVVPVGGQCWFAENLRIENYRNGDPIPQYDADADWSDAHQNSEGAWCHPNGDASKSSSYGHLYNHWLIMDGREVCPDGWHVPSDAEFIELEMFMGMSLETALQTDWRGTDQGTRLKASPSSIVPWDGTDEVGFRWVQGGWRHVSGSYGYVDDLGLLMFSPSAESGGAAYGFRQAGNQFQPGGLVRYFGGNAGDGRSLRCIKD